MVPGLLNFFKEGTSDNHLRALKAGIQNNVSNTLKKYSTHRLSPYFSIISYESRAFIFDLRVPTVPGLLIFFRKGPQIITWEPWKQGSKGANRTPLKNVRSIDYHCILASFLTNLGHCSSTQEFLWFQDIWIFFYKGTSDNHLRALRAWIQKNVPNTLKKYSIHRLSQYFSIISYESRALIFDSRVPMVPGSLHILMKEPYYNVLQALKAWIPNSRPNSLKKIDPSVITVFFICLIWIPRIGLKFEGSYGSRPLDFFYERTSDNVLRALKVRI